MFNYKGSLHIDNIHLEETTSQMVDMSPSFFFFFKLINSSKKKYLLFDTK